jgi:murein DD-endopeptidase MepM/ murein hydrolase activator NlpD
MALARVNEDNVEGYLVLNAKIDKILKNGRLGTIAVTDRVRQGLAGRARYVVTLGTLAGVATIGLAAASLDNSPTPESTSLTASADQQRAQAAGQNDRSTRENPTPGSEAPQIAPSVEATPAAPVEQVPVAPAKAPDWVNPMPRGEISSCFGPRWGTMHAGIDLFTDENEPIVAVGKGTVVAAGWVYTGYGISVVIDHGDGILTHYAHMNKTAVSEGDQVGPGTLIGYEGSTGDSTGPHLHFEVHAGMWNQIDPAPWLRDHGIDVAC